MDLGLAGAAVDADSSPVRARDQVVTWPSFPGLAAGPCRQGVPGRGSGCAEATDAGPSIGWCSLDRPGTGGSDRPAAAPIALRGYASSLLFRGPLLPASRWRTVRRTVAQQAHPGGDSISRGDL